MIEMILNFAGIYLLLGFLFAIVFVIFGIGKIDDSVNGSTIGFRLVVIPGTAIFWPYLLVRWIRGSKPPVEKSMHR